MQKYQQAYKEQNKDKIAAHKATKITCQCGITHSIGDKARHAKSEEHIDRLRYPDGFKIETADGLTLVVSYDSPSQGQRAPRGLREASPSRGPSPDSKDVVSYRSYRHMKSNKKVLNII
jgi:hypothetical protein